MNKTIILSLCLVATPLLASNPFVEFGKAFGDAGSSLSRGVQDSVSKDKGAPVPRVMRQVSYQDLFLMSYKDKTDAMIRKDARLYAVIFHPVHYENYRHNEIAIEKKLRLWGDEFIRRVHSLGALPYIQMSHRQQLGLYDPESEGFQYRPFPQTTVGTIKAPLRRAFPELMSPLPDFQLQLANTYLVSGLSMSEGKAEKMLKRRQSSTGDIDRSVYGLYLVHIDSVSEGLVKASLIRYELFENQAAAQKKARPLKVYDLKS